MDPTTRSAESMPTNGVLYIALELGSSKWVVVSGLAPTRIRTKTIPAGDLPALREEIARAKKRFGLADDAMIKSCYEAGRDGFWIHRALVQQGLENIIVDSASIEVNRRKRRVKTDRVDGQKLLQQLWRHVHGERGVLAVVNVPDDSSEDLRRVHREIERLKKERTSVVNRIRGLLTTQGIRLRSLKGVGGKLERLLCWNGSPLPKHLASELRRTCTRLDLIEQQLRDAEGERRTFVEHSSDKPMQRVRDLASLRGIGEGSAWLLVMEFFGWRGFKNRRQVGAASGLTGSPYHSDRTQTEQGISKAGNKRVRTLAVELAWCWLRYQPQSKLAAWFRERWGSGAKRNRRVGIVAVARKLLIELWRFADYGVVPDGALLKAET